MNCLSFKAFLIQAFPAMFQTYITMRQFITQFGIPIFQRSRKNFCWPKDKGSGFFIRRKIGDGNLRYVGVVSKFLHFYF